MHMSPYEMRRRAVTGLPAGGPTGPQRTGLPAPGPL